MSQRTPVLHAEASQSGRLRSTNSTNRYLSAGRYRRNASFSSAELTVIVQTVFSYAATGSATTAAASTSRNGNVVCGRIERNRRVGRGARRCALHRFAPSASVGGGTFFVSV